MSMWCPIEHRVCRNQRCLEENICRDAPDDHKDPPMTAARDSGFEDDNYPAILAIHEAIRQARGGA